jgi:hypothetical protein
MPTLPLRTPALCTRFSPPTASIRGLLAVGCELSLRLSPLPATLTRNLQLTENKTTLSLFRATLTSRDKHKSFVCHSYKKHGGVGEDVPIFARRSQLPRHAGTPATLILSYVYFITRAHPGGGGGASAFNLPLSTLDSFHQSPVTDHGSLITPP